MVKIGSRLIQQHLLSRASARSTFIKEANHLQVPVSLEVDSHSIGQTLKAVYPHFVVAKRKHGSHLTHQAGNISHKELCCEMDEARLSYKKIREIQEHLSHAYQELMHHNKP